MIEGFSDLPLPVKAIKAIDALAESFKMESWYLLETAAVLNPEANLAGINFNLQFMRKASSKPVGIRAHVEQEE